jgi:Pectin methylesterase
MAITLSHLGHPCGERLVLVTAMFLLSCDACLAEVKNITVAEDGSGDYKTVQEAVSAVRDQSSERTVIHIMPGTYQGPIIVPKDKTNVTFEGEDAAKVILTYPFNKISCVQIQGDDFRAEKVTFQNTFGDYGPALRIYGDRTVLKNCRVLGWQDTLMINNGRQYFKDCYIEGNVDFIFGSGTAVFDHCEIHSKNYGFITAASTPENRPYGFVFLNCKLTADPKAWIDPTGATTPKPSKDVKAYLGRPWSPNASVTYINCYMGDHIKPKGWHNWRKVENEKTARYAEYNSTGPGAIAGKRVPWSKQLVKHEADKVTIEAVLGGKDNWKPNE